MIGFLTRILDPKKRLVHALSKMEIPALPTSHMQTLSALRSGAPLPEVGLLIGKDPAMTATLLRTVNSAAFGLRRRVSNPGHAASLLGRGALETMVLGIAVVDTLPRAGGAELEPARFWRAAARRAATARALAEEVNPHHAHTCFTAGLLQDLAIPLLFQARPGVYGPLLAESKGGPALKDLEHEAQGYDHADVAGWLCDVWRFPEELATAIRTHHSPEDGSLPVLVSALMDIEQDNTEAVVEQAVSLFGLAPDTITHALDVGAEQGDELARAILG